MASEHVGPRTYGNWHLPVSAGLYGLGSLGTIVMVLGAFAAAISTMIWGIGAGAAAVVLLVIFLALVLVRDDHGRNVATMMTERAMWIRRKQRKGHLYRSGPQGRVPTRKGALPGVAANIELSENVDSYERPFALLRMPRTNHWTVVLIGEPTGASLVDAETIDAWVAEYAEWLAMMSNEASVEQVTVTIEAEPDLGYRLRKEVTGRVDDDAPPFAREVMDQMVATAPVGSSKVTAWVAVTFNGAKITSKRGKDRAEVGRDVAARLGRMTEALGRSGMAAVRPATAQDLREMVHVAYDPGAVRHIEQARVEGTRVDLDWSDIGPYGAETGWRHYAHDSGLSVTWAVSAPRTVVTSNVLGRLLAPDPDMARKRMTLVYNPITASEAAKIVDSDLQSAVFRQGTNRRLNVRDQQLVERSMRTAREESEGAALIEFSMLVTATVFDGEDAGERRATAKQRIESAVEAAHMRPRVITGSQDAAFAAALPLGIKTEAHIKVPKAIRQQL